MQIKSLRIKSYRSWHVNETVILVEAKKCEQKIRLYQQLRAEGCSEKTALAAIQISRITLYRWHKRYQTPRGPGFSSEKQAS